MSNPLTKKITLSDLRLARQSGKKLAMLTCYDFTMARLMQEAGVPMLLVGDSAANVILGHDTTVPVSLHFMIELTAAVRRGAPNCLLMADMPFGAYGADIARTLGFRNVLRMLKLSQADCVKLEVGHEHASLVKELAGVGVAVVAHLGLRPQTVNLLGGYRARGRTSADAIDVVELAVKMEAAGAAAILLEAVPPEVSHRVVQQTSVPIIGCGAGPACHAFVTVTHDGVGLTSHKPRFVPDLGDLSTPMREMFSSYVRMIEDGTYPAKEHDYEMIAQEKDKFEARTTTQAVTINK
jgi:3-methyl-2-oxobutanoate hydroxymethyltransferase